MLIRFFYTLFVRPFYTCNAGFFLLFFLLFFGMVQPGSIVSYHVSLMKAILGSGYILSGVLFLWAAYVAKCYRFSADVILQPSGRFLYHVQMLSGAKQIAAFFSVAIMQLLPLLAYGCLLVVMAFRWGQAWAGGVLMLYFLMAIVLLVAGCWRLINRAAIVRKGWIKFPVRKRRAKPKPLFSYLLYYSWMRHRRVILVLKLFSLALLYIPLVWNRDRFDHDSLVLFLVMLLLAHSLVAFYFVRFFEKELGFHRNLPLSISRIFTVYYLSYAALMLPEAVYLFGAGRELLSPSSVVEIYGVLLHTLLFLTAMQYGGAGDRNEFLKVVGGISFVSIFFFNGEWYGRWAVLLLLVAILLFFTGYARYEKEV